MKRTPEKELAFLSVLAATCSVTKACQAAGIESRNTVYTWRAEDENFAERWDQAKRIGAEALEDEAMRRAFDGTQKPVFHMGAECGTIREYSDTLAIFLLKGAMPEKYRENSRVELAGGTKSELRIISEFDDAGDDLL
jgi:hypothetical protein